MSLNTCANLTTTISNPICSNSGSNSNFDDILCRKDQIIKEQTDQMVRLKRELEGVASERDLLLYEVSNLRFELEMLELKRIQEDSQLNSDRSSISIPSDVISCQDTYSYVNHRKPSPLLVNHKDFINYQFNSEDLSSIIDYGNHITSRKKSLRSDVSLVMKPFRFQTMYELSQDLLDKQIELLERKYGGVKARKAALTIQRAFRRYTLVKKFKAITAMAKADKRFSRKFHLQNESLTNAETIEMNILNNNSCQNQTLPHRSLSFRDKKSNMDFYSMPRHPFSSSSIKWMSSDYSASQTVVRPTTVLSPSLVTHIRAPKVIYYSPDGINRCDECPTYWNQEYDCYTNSLRSSRSYNAKKIPPEVPKRTSSISSKSSLSEPKNCHHNSAGDNTSLSSIQSSCSDSSNEKPIDLGWKLKNRENADVSITKGQSSTTSNSKGSDQIRKRQYRVGLNLFNKKPERGISYLIKWAFVENSPQAVSRFLISRKGLSKQMIGEYLGNLQNSFNMTVLECFIQELDFAGMQIDVALRKFQTYFRLPGEAQKIERLIEVFSHRYCQCNADIVGRLRSPDTIFVLAFAIIMLNTDLHTPNLKEQKRMKLEDFIKNLRGIDDCGDIDFDILAGIYERVKSNEFKPGSDHVSQVLKVHTNIVGKKPYLAVPHRRLVCYCRLYEIPDIYKKERPGVHQREVFLFNDILVVTKILNKKRNATAYSFRNSFALSGLVVTLFEVPYYPYGIALSLKVDGKTLIQFNARNEHDRCKFAEDLKESICEMDEMESIRIEAELDRQKSNRLNRNTDNRDSGVADIEGCSYQFKASDSINSAANSIINVEDSNIKRSALSNSLLDIHEQCEKNQRRNSVGSLDSGMSINFRPTSNSRCTADRSSVYGRSKPLSINNQQQSFLGSLFNKKT